MTWILQVVSQGWANISQNQSIAEQLGISRERVWYIIREDLNMPELSTKWGPGNIHKR